MTHLIIWTIGVMFTLGLVHTRKDCKRWEEIVLGLLIVIMWPFVLGISIRNTLKDIEVDINAGTTGHESNKGA